MDGREAMMTLRTGNNRVKNVDAPKRSAFTLIELILVMSMLLIVLAVSAPTLSKFFRGRTLDSEARRFLSLTRYGQSRAVSEGVPMVLWIDAKQGAYGLREDAGYSDVDTKATDFQLGKDLSIEVADVAARSSSFGQSQSATRNAPMIRFLPDGFIGETSPRSLLIREARTDSIWISQSRNRLNYEIQTNVVFNGRR